MNSSRKQQRSPAARLRCAIEVRIEYVARLRGLLQPLLSWLTGFSLPNARPRRWQPLRHLLQSIAVLCLASTLGTCSTQQLLIDPPTTTIMV